MEVTEMPVDSIRPYENNPRNNDAAVEKVANCIREFGWQQPIVVDADGVIVCGHTRYRAALALGLATVPVHVAHDLSPEKIAAYRLADNKVAELAAWDFGKLDTELAKLGETLPDLDMALFGFEGHESHESRPFDEFFEKKDDGDENAKTDAPNEITCPHCGKTFPAP